MSGAEAAIGLVGLAASVMQMADLGWKVSYKLYAFSKKVHEAGKSIELISQDISATGAVLKQLGDEVEKDERAKAESRLCSQGLIDAASKLVEECRSLFKDLEYSIDGKESNKVILGFRHKLKWSYLEPRVELMRTNLERLKSSLAIMLNVLIYAEQVRSREEKAVLTEQQALVASFASQKSDMEKRIEQLKRTIKQDSESVARTNLPRRAADAALRSSESVHQSLAELPPQAYHTIRPMTNSNTSISPPHLHQLNSVTTLMSGSDVASKPVETEKPNDRAALIGEASAHQPSKFRELKHQCMLFEKLLEEVNSSRYAIDHGVRYRLHDGVVNLHWLEWAPLRITNEDEVLRDLLAQIPVLARHWHARVSEATLHHPIDSTALCHEHAPAHLTVPEEQGSAVISDITKKGAAADDIDSEYSLQPSLANYKESYFARRPTLLLEVEDIGGNYAMPSASVGAKGSPADDEFGFGAFDEAEETRRKEEYSKKKKAAQTEVQRKKEEGEEAIHEDNLKDLEAQADEREVEKVAETKAAEEKRETAPRSTSLSSTRSASMPGQPIFSKTNAKARARLLRAQALNRPVSEQYESSAPQITLPLDLPTTNTPTRKGPKLGASKAAPKGTTDSPKLRPRPKQTEQDQSSASDAESEAKGKIGLKDSDPSLDEAGEPAGKISQPGNEIPRKEFIPSKLLIDKDEEAKSDKNASAAGMHINSPGAPRSAQDISMPPPARNMPLGKRGKASELTLNSFRGVEQSEPSEAPQSLKSARRLEDAAKIDVLAGVTGTTAGVAGIASYNPALDAVLGIQSSNKVIVTNLPYDLGEEKLKDLFIAYEPSSAELALRPTWSLAKKLQPHNETRKSRGFGVVTFASEEMRRQAVSEMNGKEVEGRVIGVKVAIDSSGKEVTVEATLEDGTNSPGPSRKNELGPSSCRPHVHHPSAEGAKDEAGEAVRGTEVTAAEAKDTAEEAVPKPELSILKGLKVNLPGEILDNEGGDPADLEGYEVSDDGENLDKDGDVVGRAAILPAKLREVTAQAKQTAEKGAGEDVEGDNFTSALSPQTLSFDEGHLSKFAAALVANSLLAQWTTVSPSLLAL